MIRVSSLWLGILLFAGAMVAQPQTSAPPRSSTSVPPSYTITDRDNGKDIDLTTGEHLLVRLPSNPTTGYSWAVVGDPAPLKLEKSAFHKNTKSSQVMGAPGAQVLQFNASSAGIANLTVVYRRSWEYNVPPVKTFSVRVSVR